MMYVSISTNRKIFKHNPRISISFSLFMLSGKILFVYICKRVKELMKPVSLLKALFLKNERARAQLLFEELWRNATPIDEKLAELETARRLRV